MNTELLKNIYYISIPQHMLDGFEELNLKKDFKLPIETNGIENWEESTVTMEAIISAMLKILAYNREHKDIEIYKNFIFEIRPNIVNELTASAIFKSNENDYNLASEIFLAIEGLEPNNDRNLLNMAVMYEQQSEFLIKNGNNSQGTNYLNMSKDIYSKLLDRESVLTDVYFNSGLFFIKTRDFDKAELCLNAFIEYSDEEEKVAKAKEILSNYSDHILNSDVLNKAYDFIINEDEANAITLLEKFHQESNETWNSWFLHGWANRRISNFTEAIESLLKSLELNKSQVDTLNELAICYLEAGDYTKSQEYLELALKQTPEDVKIISNMGILQMKMGNIVEAKRYFETVLVFDPEDNIAKLYLEKIN